MVSVVPKVPAVLAPLCRKADKEPELNLFSDWNHWNI
jgi:hypothetical protein